MYKCSSCEKCFYSQWRKYGHERIHGRSSRREEHISDFVHWDDLGNEENYVPTESLPHSLTHSFTHSLTHLLIHLLTHLLTHLLSHALTHSHSFSRSLTLEFLG